MDEILINILRVVFGLMGFFILVNSIKTKRKGEVLGGLTFLAGSLFSFIFGSWWPLFAGFGLAWIWRLLGLDREQVRIIFDEEFSPENKLLFNEVLKVFIEKFNTFKSPQEVLEYFGQDCFIDISKMPEILKANKESLLNQNHEYHTFRFDESSTRRCVLGVSFDRNQIVNVRIQMVFVSLIGEILASNFLKKKIKPLILKLIGKENFYKGYDGESLNDFGNALVSCRIAFPKSISVYLINKRYI